MKQLCDIDPNFRLPDTIPEGMCFHEPYDKPFSLDGTAPNRRGVLCRLPEEFLSECSEGVQHLAYHLAGACVRFSTDADQLAVVWELTDTANMPHFAASGQSGMELFEETDSGSRHIQTLIPAMGGEKGPLGPEGHGCRKQQNSCFPLPGGMRHYALYLPLYNGLSQLLLGFPEGSEILPGRSPMIEKPIVAYGSSITQGGCATKAGSCYTSILCRRLDAAQINLGFSGNGKGELNMAQYIATLPMSLFLLDYDHNAPSPAHLRETHEPFFRAVREVQKDVPIIMISRPDFDLNPEENRLRRDIIQETYERAVAAGDQNVYFVDGETFYGSRERSLCSVDDIHPNDLGFLKMADVLEPIVRKALGLPEAEV